jgi:predicted enzyme related to lactoylglutathione lyase
MTTLAYTILLVKDIEKAKNFYQKFFAQEIEVDLGKLIGFKSGLALWQEDDMAEKSRLGEHPIIRGRGGMEIEFHTEDIEDLCRRLQEAKVELLHGVVKHPWEQKVFRCLDSDGHCIEVDEYLWVTAQRLAKAGRDKKEIASLFGVSEDMVTDMLS